MRIIDYGTYDTMEKFRDRCPSCRTTFEYHQYEVQKSADMNDTVAFIMCPACTTKIYAHG